MGVGKMGEERVAKNWFLLFVVNEMDPLEELDLDVMEEFVEDEWQPKIPLRLPELCKRFRDRDILRWYRRHNDHPALLPLAQLVKDVAELEDDVGLSRYVLNKGGYGDPWLTLETIYELCVPDANWSKDSNEWMKL